MFNDLTSTQTLLATRRSGKPRDMIAPGPNPSQLREIMEAAIRVPDHGKIAPWHFVIIGDDQRDALAALLVSAYRTERPGAAQAELEAAEVFARAAPTLVIALSSPVENRKVPVWEQELSAGAACMNLLIAAHAQGFIGSWLTGWATYNDDVRNAFGGPNDKIAGFIFLGSPARELEERPRPDYEGVVKHWTP